MNPPPISKLCICQQNMNRSLIGQSSFLNSVSPDAFEIILLQEPYIDHIGLTRASHDWHVLYPTGHHDRDAKSRSVIFVNSTLSTNTWTAVDVDSPDVTALVLTTARGPLWIFNFYNDQENDDALDAVRTAMESLRRQWEREEQPDDAGEPMVLWAGDFNRHHPFWELASNTHLLTRRYLDAAQPLVDAITTYGLFQLLPAEVPTLRANGTGNHTHPDNVFASENLAESFLSCATRPEFQPPCCDHFPIHTHLDLSLAAAEDGKQRWNWREADPGEFLAALQDELDSRDLPTGDIKTAEELEKAITDVTESIYRARDRTVPELKNTPFTKRWWTKELAKERKQVQRLAWRSYKYRDDAHHDSHRDYRRARNTYGENIRKAKKEHWTLGDVPRGGGRELNLELRSLHSKRANRWRTHSHTSAHSDECRRDHSRGEDQ